jgi:hypothetical protein
MKCLSGNLAELSNAPILHPRDPDSNLDSNNFLILFVSHLNLNVKGVDSWAFFIYMYIYQKRWIPTFLVNSQKKLTTILLGSYAHRMYAPPHPFGHKAMPIECVTVALTDGSSRGKILL